MTAVRACQGILATLIQYAPMKSAMPSATLRPEGAGSRFMRGRAMAEAYAPAKRSGTHQAAFAKMGLA
jgi:hypothetical protein